MKYTVKLTPHAIAEISETIAYISHVLLVPDTARAWADHLQSEISGLDTLPERYPQVEREPWHRLGIRKMPVKNFIVYYYVDQENKTVWIWYTMQKTGLRTEKQKEQADVQNCQEKNAEFHGHADGY